MTVFSRIARARGLSVDYVSANLIKVSVADVCCYQFQCKVKAVFFSFSWYLCHLQIEH